MSETSQLQQRLTELQEEHKKGHQMLAELHQQEADLQQKLLRISGAIQVLEELLASAPSPDGPSPDNEADTE